MAVRLEMLVSALASSLLVMSAAGQANLRDDDFKTEALQRRSFGNESFIFTFNQTDTNTDNSTLKGSFINNNAALGTLPGPRVGQNLITLQACAVNQPHSHPRGTEISFVTEGELFFGFLEENEDAAGTSGGRFIAGNVTQGHSIFIPQGLIHFAQNLQCTEAQFIASFPSEDPGTQTTAANFFKLPEFTLRGTLGLDNDTIAEVVKAVAQAKNPSSDYQCLQRCGMA